jgi:hypothetical protein
VGRAGREGLARDMRRERRRWTSLLLGSLTRSIYKSSTRVVVSIPDCCRDDKGVSDIRCGSS